MREVKFRAWDQQHKRMYHFTSQWWGGEYQSLAFKVQEEQSGDYCFDFDEEQLSPIMQATGLRDRHGKEIWEGDVVKVDIPIVHYGKGQIVTEVVFADGAFKIDIPQYGATTFTPCVSEVLGNVHEHPHLLRRYPPQEE